jgi:hypothetical protein
MRKCTQDDASIVLSEEGSAYIPPILSIVRRLPVYTYPGERILARLDLHRPDYANRGCNTGRSSLFPSKDEVIDGGQKAKEGYVSP